jgi:hypothetical protein
MNLSILHMLVFLCGMRISNLLIYFNARHFCALYGFTFYTKEPTAAGHQSHNSYSTAVQTTAVGVSELHCLKGWGGGGVGKGMFNISGFPSSSSPVLSAKLPTGRNFGCIRRAGKKFLAAREYYKNYAELFQKQLKKGAKVQLFLFSILFIHDEGYRELRYVHYFL